MSAKIVDRSSFCLNYEWVFFKLYVWVFQGSAHNVSTWFYLVRWFLRNHRVICGHGWLWKQKRFQQNNENNRIFIWISFPCMMSVIHYLFYRVVVAIPSCFIAKAVRGLSNRSIVCFPVVGWVNTNWLLLDDPNTLFWFSPGIFI